MKKLTVAVIGLLLMLLAGCSDGGGDKGTPGPSQSKPPTSQTTTPETEPSEPETSEPEEPEETTETTEPEEDPPCSDPDAPGCPPPSE